MNDFCRVTGKVRHESRRAAVSAIRRLQQKRRGKRRADQRRRPMHAYMCQMCAGWHVGHSCGRKDQ